MKENQKTVEVENLGPIPKFKFTLESPGVTTIVGPNGVGKSILVGSLADVAAGEGGLPLRHGSEKGRIDGLGVHVAINPKQTRCAGEFAVEHLEGKLNLASLVDPGVKDEVAADKRRIKALIALTGVEADRHLFDTRPEFDPEEFETIVTSEALKSGDLIDMAAKIARDYQAEARTWEKTAEKDEQQAQSIKEQIDAVDMTKEHDPEKLQAAFFEAQDKYSHSVQHQQVAAERVEKAQKAREELIRWDARNIPTSVEEAKKAVTEAQGKVDGLVQHKQDLLKQMDEIQHSIELCDREIDTANSGVKLARESAELISTHAERRAACLKVIADSDNYVRPTDEQVAEYKTAYDAAKLAMEDGVRVRDARMKQASVTAFAESAKSRREKAERYRKAAGITDSVLSDAIESKWVKIVSEGVHKRVYGYVEAKDMWAPYHELSATEKWHIAIEIGVERVGDGGLLFIPQEAWEGVDVWNRKFIDDHAKARGVYILTAEATRDETLGKELQAHTFAS